MLRSLCCCLGFCDNCGTVADWMMVMLTFVAICLTIWGYTIQKKISRYEVFSEYSKRYSEDKNLKVVSCALIDYMENKKENENINVDNLTIYQKEMFLRFFEELELQIENKRMDKPTVQDFFVYYAVAAAMCEPFVKNTELIDNNPDSEVWGNYKRLVERYQDMQKLIAEEYAKHHDKSAPIRILFDIKPKKKNCWKRLFH